MPDTLENLKTAFAGESQAYQKYSAFARKAAQDKLPNMARLFRATAEAERIHAEAHLKAMEGVGTTAENLQTAIGGETYEFTTMYPPMLVQAEGEAHKARRMFGYAVKAEEVHARLYKAALEAARLGKDIDPVEMYLCPVCGSIEFGKPTEACPICGTKPDKLVLM